MTREKSGAEKEEKTAVCCDTVNMEQAYVNRLGARIRTCRSTWTDTEIYKQA